MTKHPIEVANRCEEFIHAVERRYQIECDEKGLNAQEREYLADEVGASLRYISKENSSPSHHQIAII
jgi:hypothetical protein